MSLTARAPEPGRVRPAHVGGAACRWSVDVAVSPREDERGPGTGRLMYGELLPLLASLGHVTAQAGITLPNAAGTGLHEAVGSTPVGVHAGTGTGTGAGTTSAGGSARCGTGRARRPSRARAAPRRCTGLSVLTSRQMTCV